jgi:hypothetical protein
MVRPGNLLLRNLHPVALVPLLIAAGCSAGSRHQAYCAHTQCSVVCLAKHRLELLRVSCSTGCCIPPGSPVDPAKGEEAAKGTSKQSGPSQSAGLSAQEGAAVLQMTRPAKSAAWKPLAGCWWLGWLLPAAGACCWRAAATTLRLLHVGRVGRAPRTSGLRSICIVVLQEGQCPATSKQIVGCRNAGKLLLRSSKLKGHTTTSYQDASDALYE